MAVNLSTKDKQDDTEYMSIDDAMATGIDPLATDVLPIPTQIEPMATSVEPVATEIEPMTTEVEPMATAVNHTATGIHSPATGSGTIATEINPMATGLNSPATGVDHMIAGVDSPATGHRSKGRRRSTFSKKRVSILDIVVPSPLLGQHVSTSSTDLHKLIDENLPNEYRLAKLTRLALKHTFDTLGCEFKGKEWFDQMRVTAEDNANTLISKLQDENRFSDACSVPQILSASCNENYDRTASVEYTINRLEEESQKWDELLEELKLETAEAEKKAENLELTREELSESIKVAAEACYMKTKPDYKEIVQTAQNSLEMATLQVEMYCNTVNVLGSAVKTADAMEERLLQQLHEASFNGMPSQSSVDPVRNLLSTITQE